MATEHVRLINAVRNLLDYEQIQPILSDDYGWSLYEAATKALEIAEAKEKALADEHGTFPPLEEVEETVDLIRALKITLRHIDPRALTEPDYDHLMKVVNRLSEAEKEATDV